MNVYFPLWQGAGLDNSILKGSKILKDQLSKEMDFVEVDSFTEKASNTINDIQNYHSILSNLTALDCLLKDRKPEKIFTVGGDCSLEIIPISYLYKRYGNNLTVLWLDAHADLNTPESSPSKTLHGMPIRVLLGNGDKKLLSLTSSVIQPSDILYVGLRDVDPPEKEYINENIIKIFAATDLNDVINSSKYKIYIHVDLDILDPSSFGSVVVPTPKGITKEVLISLINKLKESKEIVGGSVVEFSGKNPRDAEFAADVFRLLAT